MLLLLFCSQIALSKSTLSIIWPCFLFLFLFFCLITTLNPGTHIKEEDCKKYCLYMCNPFRNQTHLPTIYHIKIKFILSLPMYGQSVNLKLRILKLRSVLEYVPGHVKTNCDIFLWSRFYIVCPCRIFNTCI
jgi:hypothetical protein